MGQQRQPMSDEVRARLQRLIAEDRAGSTAAAHTEQLDDTRDDETADQATPVAPGPGPVVPRLRFERRHLQVIAVVLVIGFLLTGYWLIRSREVAAVEVAGTPAGQTSPSALNTPIITEPTPSATPVAMVSVHVIGAVAKPGVVQAPAGARVGEVISLVGGLTTEARPGDLNFAAPVPDGAQIWVGDASNPGGEIRPAGSAPGPGSPHEPSDDNEAPVNLNTATTAQLEELPGVGPVTATNIVTWRETNGGFQSVEQLQEVDGIGPKTYERLAPLVTV